MFVLPVLDLQSPGKLSTSTHNGKKHPGAWMHKLQTLIQGLDFSSSWGREKRFKFIEMGNCKRIHVSVQYLCILCFSSQMVYERRLKVQGVKRPRYGQFVSITTPIPVYVLSLINLKKQVIMICLRSVYLFKLKINMGKIPPLTELQKLGCNGGENKIQEILSRRDTVKLLETENSQDSKRKKSRRDESV